MIPARLDASAASKQPDAFLEGPRRKAAIACVLAAIVLVVLDAAIANIALPAIARSLQVTPAVSVRVITVYQMALVMALLPCAALGESLGYRRVYTAGVALFSGASALCTFAPSLDWLVVARFVQGLGGACIMSLGIALIRFVVPQSQLGTAIGWNALAVALGSAAGPTVGSLILSAASWPWLFAVNLPLGALVLLATRALPYVPGSGRKLDFVSVVLNAAAFALLVLGAELVPDDRALALAMFALAALAMLALVRREMPREAPLIPLDLLRDGSFRVSVIASVCCFSGQSAAMVALPFYLQHGLGLDALHTGLLITPWPLTVALVAPVSGRLASRVSSAWLCALGGTLLAAGLAGAALWPLHGEPFVLIPFVMLCGVGFGLFQVPNNRNMFLSAPRARSGAAGGMQGTARLTGQTIGAVMMTLLLAMTSVEVAPRIGLGSAALLALIAGLVSTLRVPPGEPSARETDLSAP
ncbi:MAG: hypothetical protein JWN48_24 [Myxococcaceae bacterium]|nr:hypothetical protein [Myxococcaceae bacterium]